MCFERHVILIKTTEEAEHHSVAAALDETDKWTLYALDLPWYNTHTVSHNKTIILKISFKLKPGTGSHCVSSTSKGIK